MQWIKRKIYLLVCFLTLIIFGRMGDACAVISLPSSIVVPQNGNVGDIIWESVPAEDRTELPTTQDSTLRAKTFVYIYGSWGKMNGPGRSYQIADGLILAVKGTVRNMSGETQFAAAIKNDYTSEAINASSNPDSFLYYKNETVMFGIDNNDNYPGVKWVANSFVSHTKLRAAIIRTKESITPGVYSIPAVNARAVYLKTYTTDSFYDVDKTVMNAGNITVLGRTCSMSVSNTHINFGAMQRQGLDSDLSGNRYSDVTASCTNGAATDAEQKVRIKFAGGKEDNVPTNMDGVVIRGSLNEQPCSAKAGWLPMDDTEWSELSPLAAGATNPSVNRRINWKVCQTLRKHPVNSY